MKLINKKLKPILVISIAVFGLCCAVGVYADTSTKNPSSVTDYNAIGSHTWSDPSNASADDSNYATCYDPQEDGSWYDYRVYIIKSDGSLGTVDKSIHTAFTGSDVTRTYGGPTNLWGLSWTSDDIKSSNFGVVFSASTEMSDITHYLKADHFDFSAIPDGATISGITVQVKGHQNFSDFKVYINSISITITYSASSTFAFQQAHFRFREDSVGLNTDGGWLAGEDTTPTDVAKGVIQRLRVGIYNNNDAISNQVLKLQWRAEAGSWADLASTGDISFASSSQYSNGAAITSHLLTEQASSTWVNGTGQSNATSTGSYSCASGKHHTEFEWVFQTSFGSSGTYYLRVVKNDGSDLDGVPLVIISFGIQGTPGGVEIATPSNVTASNTVSYTVDFTTTSTVPKDGKISIAFPVRFNVSGATFSSWTGFDGGESVSVSGQVVTITRDNTGTASSSGSKRIVLSNIVNVATIGNYYQLLITTKNSSGTTIEGPLGTEYFQIFSSHVDTNIDGLYYLRSATQTHGQNSGGSGAADVGTLSKSAPTTNEVRYCSGDIVFYFDVNGTYTQNYALSNIYYHIWLKGNESQGYLGFLGNYLHEPDIYMTITLSTLKKLGDYYLYFGKETYPTTQYVFGNAIYDKTVRWDINIPYIISYPNQYSFVILNLPDDATLQSLDSDSDGLNDYDELFVYSTNPYDSDTDDDGWSDSYEVDNSSDPLDPSSIPTLNIPSSPTVEASSTTSLNATINAQHNYPDITFSIKVDSQYVQANGILGGSPVYQTKGGTGWSTPVSITGLSGNTQYAVSVNAKKDAATTAYSSTSSKYTLANTPVAGTATNITSTSLRFNWSSGGAQKDYAYGTTSECLDGTTTNTYLDLSSLTGGTQYTRYICARNGDNTKTSSITLSEYTLPAQVTGVSATDGTYTDKVRVTWNSVTGATGYKVYDSVSATWTDVGDVTSWDHTLASAPTISHGSTVASDGTNVGYVALSLSGASANNGSAVTYKVKAYNGTGDGAESATDTGYRGVGSLTYQWQRSLADSDADYSNISGATSSTYNDTGAPIYTVNAPTSVTVSATSTSVLRVSFSGASITDGAGRYYQCILNATGASQQTSTSNRGYRDDTIATTNGYEIFSDTSSGGSYSTSEGTTSASPFDDNGLSANTRKYYKVKTESAAGTWSSLSTSYDGKYTLANTPIAETASNITSTSLRFNWSSGGAQKDYAYGTTSECLDGTTTNTYLDLSSLTACTEYTRYVCAKNGDDIKTGAISLEASTTGCGNVPPDKPVGLDPADTDITLTPTLEASAYSDAESDTHLLTQWQISSGDDFSDTELVFDDTSSTDTETIPIPLAILKPATTYYWRVRYSDVDGWSDWSDAIAFTTESLGDFLTDPANEGIEVTDTDIITSDTGTVVQAFRQSPDNLPNASGYLFYNGIFSFKIDGITPGATVLVTFQLDEPFWPGYKWLKYYPLLGIWDDIYAAHIVSGIGTTRVTLTFTDGGLEDADGLVNGAIVDPSGPAIWIGSRSGDDNEKHHCFIATAAYGTPMASEVRILREFRNEYLLSNPIGEGFVNTYYNISPPIALFIKEHPVLKSIVRNTLKPLIWMSEKSIEFQSPK